MARDFKLPDDVEHAAVEQLLSKTWEEHEALEHAGYVLFPDKIFRRRKDGSIEEKAVMLRVPRMPEQRKARVMARTMAAEDELDPRFDRDMIEDLETLCLLSMAIRNSSDPFEPWEEDPRVLERIWDKSSLTAVWARLDALTTLIDPRPQSITNAEMLVLLAKISKERNLGPLAAYGSDAQTSFVTTMADLLLSYLDPKSSSEPSEPSTVGESQSTNLSS